MVEEYLEKNEKLFAVFMELEKKAYDREALSENSWCWREVTGRN